MKGYFCQTWLSSSALAKADAESTIYDEHLAYLDQHVVKLLQNKLPQGLPRLFMELIEAILLAFGPYLLFAEPFLKINTVMCCHGLHWGGPGREDVQIPHCSPSKHHSRGRNLNSVGKLRRIV